MTYLKYYNLMRFMRLTSKGLVFAGVFFVAHLIQYLWFFTEDNVYTVGPIVIFMIATFVMHLYRYQIHHDPTNILHQFPLDGSGHVKYGFLSVFFLTMMTLVVYTLIVGALFLLFVLVSDASSFSGNLTEGLSPYALIYIMGHHLLILASVFPLAYVKSHFKRYIIAAVGFILLFAFNIGVLTLASHAMPDATSSGIQFQGYMLKMIDHLPGVQWVVPAYFTASVALVLISYRKALALSAY